jgi:hypothetical protein
LNRSSSRMLMVILSVAAIAASGAGSSATGQLTRQEKRTFELGYNRTLQLSRYIALFDSWHLGRGVAKVCSSTLPLFIRSKLSTGAEYFSKCCCANEEHRSVARQSA